jgi:hypothetical protein
MEAKDTVKETRTSAQVLRDIGMSDREVYAVRTMRGYIQGMHETESGMKIFIMTGHLEEAKMYWTKEEAIKMAKLHHPEMKAKVKAVSLGKKAGEAMTTWTVTY